MKTMAVLAVAFATLVVALILSLKNDRQRMPLSERAVHGLLSLAAWIENSATAWDSAIVRYRRERRLVRIVMESTAQRLYPEVEL